MTGGFAADVLICGAGAAGLTLAVELARRNVAFRLIDKAPGPFHGSRGKGVQPRTLEVFEDLGILERIAAAGGRYPPQRCYRAGGADETPVTEAREPTPGEPYPMPLMVAQFRTEAVLRQRLAELGHRPEFGRELTGFAQDDEGVTARIGADSLRVRYLVAGDGGRSLVRHALEIGFPGKTLNVRAVVADVALDGLDRDAWHRWSDDAPDQLNLCPLCGTDLFVLQAPVALEGDVDLTAAGLTRMVAARSGRRDIRVRSVAWASAYTMNARLADRYRMGRVFLAGDAAHVHPPTGGQGLNTSVQDSYNLGWKLAAVLTGAPGSLLDTYEAERRPIAAHMLGMATQYLDAMTQGASLRRGREAQQLDLGYRGSPLSLAAPMIRAGITAGDRAPDAPVRGAAGQRTRLFELFKGPHWTLLGYELATPVRPRAGLRIHSIGPRGDIVDESGHLRDLYGLAPGELVLVRPDGYVGAVSSGAATLEAYLTGVGLR